MVVGAMERKKVDEAPAASWPAPAPPTASEFDVFYRLHRDRLARALSMSLRDVQLGTDAVDEAFARACQRWSAVREYRNPEGWVYRVAMNWARSWLRRKRRERDKQPLVAVADHSHDKTIDVDLQRAIDRLSDEHRDVVVSRYFLEWSVGETAVALDIAEGTVKSRLSRALSILERDLGSDAGVIL